MKRTVQKMFADLDMNSKSGTDTLLSLNLMLFGDQEIRLPALWHCQHPANFTI